MNAGANMAGPKKGRKRPSCDSDQRLPQSGLPVESARGRAPTFAITFESNRAYAQHGLTAFWERTLSDLLMSDLGAVFK